MKEKKCIGKRGFVFSFVLLFVLIYLVGCSKDGEIVSSNQNKHGEKESIKAMGKYIEKEIKLPEGETMKSILNFQKNPEGSLVLFTKDITGPHIVYYYYTLKENNLWEKKECQWLNNKKFNSKNTYLNIIFGKDDNIYATYRIAENEESSAPTQIIFTKDGKKAEEINIPDLSKKDANGLYPYIKKIEVLANGNIVVCDSGKASVYDKKRGDKIFEFATELGKIETYDDTIYHYNTQGNVIDLYDGKKGELIKSYPVTLKNSYGAFLRVKEDKSIALYSQEGIQEMKANSDLWEIIADGSSGTIGSPKYFCNSFLTGDNGDYYVLYNCMEETAKLSHYIFDKDTPLEPDTTLTVFSLKDNSNIRQAASEFQAANPNVKVDFQVAEGEDVGVENSDYIRTLNTEILAGKGPDVLILDGLPEKSYIEKGILKDMNDIIEPLVLEGEFLPNIAEVYKKEGKIYTIPTKIGIPMAFGEKELTSFARDLSKVSQYITKNPDKTMFGVIDKEALFSFYLDALSHDLLSEDGSINIEQMRLLLDSMKTIIEHSKLSDTENNIYPSTEWRLIEDGNLLYVGNMLGFFASESCFSAISPIHGSFAAINQSFVPIGKIGINKASEKLDIAEQFVKMVLSKEVQETDYLDGFPVNKQVLKSYETIERTSAEAYGGSFKGSDGKTYEMAIKWPVKEQRKKMIEICESVTKEACFDTKLKEIVMDKTVKYFAGNQSIEETMDNIVQAAKAYLAE